MTEAHVPEAAHAADETGGGAPGAEAQGAMDAGTFGVLRDRVARAAAELSARAGRLNARRTEEFGAAGLGLLRAEQLRTAADTAACDVVHVGGALLLGHHGAAPADREAEPADVLALFALDAGRLAPAAESAVPGLLDDARFRRDFAELHRYYRSARFTRFDTAGPFLLAVFRTGDRDGDVRALRWRIAPDGTPAYVDAKGERELRAPEPYEFTWQEAGREDHVPGRYPLVSLAGRLHVGIAEGALTVKSTADTEVPEGLHREPVDEPLQSLADARIAHAAVGPLTLLRVRPYNEDAYRYLVHNERTGEVVRLDGIGAGCRLLPEEQGIVFAGGYYLANAPAGSAARTFDTGAERGALGWHATVRSPNGEDVLYVFRTAGGRTLLLPYNLIREEVAAPLPADGHALFPDGTLVLLRSADSGPTRVHPVQLWRTPYTSATHAAAQPEGDGPLARVGNAELVRGISDAYAVVRLADGMEPNATVFRAVTAACTRLADQHPWLGTEGLERLDEPLGTLRGTAEQAIDEVRRVEELRAQAGGALDEAAREVTALVRRARGEVPGGAAGWVSLLTELRRARGRVAALGDLRYVDTGRLGELDGELADALDATGRRAVDRLAAPGAFDGTHREIEELESRAAAVATAAETAPLAEEIGRRAESLTAVTDVVGGLEVSDATRRTALLAAVGEVTGAVNRARAVLERRRDELRESEGRAEFEAEFALLGQAVAGGLAAAGTPEECDDQLGRLMVQLENLESRFGALDAGGGAGGFLERLADRREEIHETFSARKQARIDARARYAERLAVSAERVLGTVARRSSSLATLDEVHAYFGSEPLVAKVRTTAGELRELGEQVRADELEGRLKAAQQEAARALRDRADLYDAEGAVRLGRHRFSVNSQPFELTLVPQDGALVFAVTGTDYRAPVHDEEFAATRAFWDQPLASESPEVYRAEHLAATILEHAAAERGLDALHEAATEGRLLAAVREFSDAAYDEGYDRGVHDRDAARLLDVLLRLHRDAGLLRFRPDVRAAAQLFWGYGVQEAARREWTTRAASLARARSAFGPVPAAADLAAELDGAAGEFLQPLTAELGELPGGDLGGYLFEELSAGSPRFVTGAPARTLLDGFRAALGGEDSAAAKEFGADLAALDGDLRARLQLATAWLHSYAQTRGGEARTGAELPGDLTEAAVLALDGGALEYRDVRAPLRERVPELLGTHPRLAGGELDVRLDEFLDRTRTFRAHRVPAHRAYTRRRNALLAAERRRLHLDAHKPRVLPTFVRNRLIDEVYLPLIGDNLAKQLGAAGEERRTDSQGMLLLLSPPGYGKTTLVEYVAARLGLVQVTVDGPALGHRTTSLDPAAAPDAAARREVEKINFALEMGSNVLLYLDDIQHTSSELLQKFIPLCDAQRRIDGVAADGTPRSFDLRGKRFAVCMAGNPFTESGSRFRVPDMLANRADVWNLGEVLSGREELFALSHVENALTANPTLAPLASRDRGDIDLLVRLAAGDGSAEPDRLVHPYSATELEQVRAVLRHLLRVRRTVLAVNSAYIASAGVDPADRTEPPFLLQGSYRNTNKLAERLIPAMNDAELEALIDDHYTAEAQTLTTGAEANLLKLAELRGRLDEEGAARWERLKAAHLR